MLRLFLFAGNDLQIVAIVIISGKYVTNKTVFTSACRGNNRAAGSAGCLSCGDTDNADGPPPNEHAGSCLSRRGSGEAAVPESYLSDALRTHRHRLQDLVQKDLQECSFPPVLLIKCSRIEIY